jgi:hypothetical protein
MVSYLKLATLKDTTTQIEGWIMSLMDDSTQGVT